MGRNKMYKVERLSTEHRDSEVVFIGRIRDAKRSLATLKNEYETRGFKALNTGFSLLIYNREKDLVRWIYTISENEEQNNSRNSR